MKKIFSCGVAILVILTCYSCKKSRSPAPLSSDSDTVAIIKKMVGLHQWTGSFHSRRQIDTNSYLDTTKPLSFSCPIVMLTKDSILFDSASHAKILKVRWHDTVWHTLQFNGLYEDPNHPTWSFYTILVYYYLSDSLYFYESYYATPEKYNYEIELSSP